MPTRDKRILRQAFGFLKYAEGNVRDFIFALHPDLIYEDDEGKPHMQPKIVFPSCINELDCDILS